MSHLLIDALRCKPTFRRPCWLMRQAGRYLPEYRALRAKAGSFMTLCQDSDLACEVTMQPLARFDLDAAIVFSDILTIPDAMGLGLHFIQGQGPAFKQPIMTAADVAALPMPDPMDELVYVMDAIRKSKAALAGKVPLIGFAGSPWTLAAYMVKSGRANDFADALAMCQQAPTVMDALLQHLAKATTAYLLAQVASGADVLMLFDSWGGVLPTGDFQRFSLQHLQTIIAGIKAKHPEVPIILFCRQVHHAWSELANSGADALGIDQGVSLQQAKLGVAGQVALQGNLDPKVLLQSPAAIAQAVQAVLADYGDDPGLVFNLGHGVTPDVPPAHVAAMIDAVRKHSMQSLATKV